MIVSGIAKTRLLNVEKRFLRARDAFRNKIALVNGFRTSREKESPAEAIYETLPPSNFPGLATSSCTLPLNEYKS